MVKALFLPYAVVLRQEDSYYWQRNIGRYLDQISLFFEEVKIICHVVDQHNKEYFREGRPLYTYQIVSPQIRVISLPKRRGIDSLRTLNEYIFDVDFVYIFLPSYKGLAAAWLCTLNKRPYAIYIGANWEEIAPFMLHHIRQPIKTILTRSIQWLEKVAVSRATFTIAHGEVIVKKYDGQACRVFSAIPIMNWGQAEFLRRHDTCQDKDIQLLYVGTLSPRKGLEYLIKGFELAQKRMPNMQLTIVGAGQLQYEVGLKDLVSNLGLETKICFAGYVSDPAIILKYYQDSDLFILPTLGEGFPRVIYEAHTQGLPVVTTKIGSIPSMLTDQENALLIDPASSEAIASAIDRLINHPELRQRLMRGGYDLVNKRLIKGNAINQFQDLLFKYRVLVSQ